MSVDNVSVKTAVQNRSRAKLGTVAITTTDFFTPRVVYNHEFVPGEDWRVHFNSMTRCMPLYKPVYADINQHVRGFFVPYRTLLANFNDSLEQCRVAYTSNNLPYFTSKDFILALFQNEEQDPNYGESYIAESVLVEIDPDTKQPLDPDTDPFPEDKFDFETFTTTVVSEVTHYWKQFVKLGKKGKMLWSNLVGLGYKFDTAAYLTSSDSIITKKKSAMPLLSLCKIWMDYYISPRDADYKYMYSVMREIFLGKYIDLGSVRSGETRNLLSYLLQCLENVNYNLDYFTSAWEHPHGPGNDTVLTGTNIRDPAYELTAPLLHNNYVMQTYGSINSGTGAQLIYDTDPATYDNIFSQYLDTALHLVSDRLKRWQLSGLRSVDRYLTQFGIKLKSEYDNRTVYLGKKSSVFNITDVTSLGDNALAEYKGKAIDYNLDGNFDFNGQEFGFIVLVSTVVPTVKYYNGEERHIHHESMTQLFDPSWEKLGVQGIRADELFAGYTHTDQLPSDADFVPADHIVGYTDKFAEYKCQPHAVLSGDFIFETVNLGMDSWHLFRKILDRPAQLDDYFRSAYDREQYDRIFEFRSDSQDNTLFGDGFIQVFHFDVPASLPMAAMFDSYEWSDDDGREVTVNNGGSFKN